MGEQQYIQTENGEYEPLEGLPPTEERRVETPKKASRNLYVKLARKINGNLKQGKVFRGQLQQWLDAAVSTGVPGSEIEQQVNEWVGETPPGSTREQIITLLGSASEVVDGPPPTKTEKPPRHGIAEGRFVE